VAVLLFGYDLQRTLRTKHTESSLVEPEEFRPDASEVQTIEDKDHYELIGKRHLFMFPEGAELKGRSDGDRGQEVVETTLDIQLKGTVVSPSGYVLALIEDFTNHREDLYMVGDSIQDAEIMEIRRDRVVLRRGGTEETLALFVEEKRRKGRRPPPKPGEVTRGEQARGAARSREPAPPSVGQRQAQQKVRSLMAQLRLRPHFQDGKPAGFIVGQVHSGGVFEEAGLQKGDIIVAVNDEPVITPNQLLQAYRQVAEDEMLWMDIIRDGEEGDTVEIDLDEIMPGE
jgi:general secretion pathway protein C